MAMLTRDEAVCPRRQRVRKQSFHHIMEEDEEEDADTQLNVGVQALRQAARAARTSPRWRRRRWRLFAGGFLQDSKEDGTTRVLIVMMRSFVNVERRYVSFICASLRRSCFVSRYGNAEDLTDSLRGDGRNVWCTCLPLLWISAFFLCAFFASSSDLRRSSFFSNLSCCTACTRIPTFFGSSSCLCEKSFFALSAAGVDGTRAQGSADRHSRVSRTSEKKGWVRSTALAGRGIDAPRRENVRTLRGGAERKRGRCRMSFSPHLALVRSVARGSADAFHLTVNFGHVGYRKSGVL